MSRMMNPYAPLALRAPQEHLLTEEKASILKKALALGASAEAKKGPLSRSLAKADQMSAQREGSKAGSPEMAVADVFANIVGGLKGRKTERDIAGLQPDMLAARQAGVDEQLRATQHGENVKQYELGLQEDTLQQKRDAARAAAARAGQPTWNDDRLALKELRTPLKPFLEYQHTTDTIDDLLSSWRPGGKRYGTPMRGIGMKLDTRAAGGDIVFNIGDQLSAGVGNQNVGTGARAEAEDNVKFTVAGDHAGSVARAGSDEDSVLAQRINAEFQKLLGIITRDATGLEASKEVLRNIERGQNMDQYSSTEATIMAYQALKKLVETKVADEARYHMPRTLDMYREGGGTALDHKMQYHDYNFPATTKEDIPGPIDALIDTFDLEEKFNLGAGSDPAPVGRAMMGGPTEYLKGAGRAGAAEVGEFAQGVYDKLTADDKGVIQNSMGYLVGQAQAARDDRSPDVIRNNTDKMLLSMKTAGVSNVFEADEFIRDFVTQRYSTSEEAGAVYQIYQNEGLRDAVLSEFPRSVEPESAAPQVPAPAPAQETKLSPLQQAMESLRNPGQTRRDALAARRDAPGPLPKAVQSQGAAPSPVDTAMSSLKKLFGEGLPDGPYANKPSPLSKATATLKAKFGGDRPKTQAEITRDRPKTQAEITRNERARGDVGRALHTWKSKNNLGDTPFDGPGGHEYAAEFMREYLVVNEISDPDELDAAMTGLLWNTLGRQDEEMTNKLVDRWMSLSKEVLTDAP